MRIADPETMVAYVQMYIHIRKDKEVKIEINTPRDLRLLVKAYNIAVRWMTENGTTIRQV